MCGASFRRPSLGVLVCLFFFVAACGDETHEVPDPPGDPVHSELSRDENPDVDGATFAEFTGDNRDFAFSLFDEIRHQEGEAENVFISPHSISSALAMIYAGARDETKEQMAQALRFELEDELLFPAFNKLDLELLARPEVETDDEPPQLAIINQTWGDTSLDYVEDYLDVLALHFGAGMRSVDFTQEHAQIRQEINHWVEEATNERIEDLLPQGSLDEQTRMVLVNAIYFDADWETPFDESHTNAEPFHLLDESTVDVPLMRQTDNFDYHLGDETVAVSLPYVGEELSMVAWMPSDADADFSQWEEDFDRADFDALIAEMGRGELRVLLPRFELNLDYTLSEIFEQLAMVDAFDPIAANLEGIAHPPLGEDLYVKEIFHQTFIKVDEEGTEAAAATGGVVSGDIAPPPPPEMRFDRPFYYAIYDHPTDSILFMGRLTAP